MWSLPPSPSLAPLTELNELSILSVLEESSWERARGQREEGEGLGGGKETKAKNLAPIWFITASLVQLYLSALVKDGQPGTASCQSLDICGMLGRQTAQTLRSKPRHFAFSDLSSVLA